MELREAAKRERQAFAEVLGELKAKFGIEQKKVAEWLGLKESRISHMAKVERDANLTERPPDGWRTTLAERLRRLGDEVASFADRVQRAGSSSP